MAFKRGHRKVGGRRAGTPNRLTGEMREIACRLLDSPAYLQALEKRLIEGTAGQLELFFWRVRLGKERPESVEAAEGPPDLVQLFEHLGRREQPGPAPSSGDSAAPQS